MNIFPGRPDSHLCSLRSDLVLSPPSPDMNFVPTGLKRELRWSNSNIKYLLTRSASLLLLIGRWNICSRYQCGQLLCKLLCGNGIGRHNSWSTYKRNDPSIRRWRWKNLNNWKTINRRKTMNTWKIRKIGKQWTMEWQSTMQHAKKDKTIMEWLRTIQ